MNTATASQLTYQVQLQQFEGPMALLLHLIRKEEMDIYDIPIHTITKQYLEYIRKMKELDLEVAGEFVAMAATLIQIKSQMLLPTYNEEGEVVETEDPRKELVQKLLEYQKFQEAAHRLYERPLLKRDFWLRGSREEIVSDDESEILIEEENALFALIGAYRSAIKNQKKNVHHVGEKEMSIAQRIQQIRDQLKPGEKTTLVELLQEKRDQKTLLITFLSLLELGKINLVSLFQSEPFADIYVEPQAEIHGDVVVRVEEYDSVDAEDVAASLMDKAETEALEGDEFDDEEASELPTDQVIEDGSIQMSLAGGLDHEDLVEGLDEAASDDEIEAEEARLFSENEIENDDAGGESSEENISTEEFKDLV